MAYGINEQGQGQIISFRLATAESEEQWRVFLDHLFNRGLQGKSLRMVITDGCTGLHQALDIVYPDVPRQRCWAHKLRNVSDKLPKRLHGACMSGARRIYQAETQRDARARFQQWATEWRETVPKAVECIERELDEPLSFLVCPKEDWKKVRTTNAIERSFREIRRRTKPMSCFANAESCRRIIYGIVTHLNTYWKKRRRFRKSTQKS